MSRSEQAPAFWRADDDGGPREIRAGGASFLRGAMAGVRRWTGGPAGLCFGQGRRALLKPTPVTGLDSRREAVKARRFGAGHPAVEAGRIGVLLVNLGTPEGTSYWPMRRYLSEFLSDRRVIEWPRAVW